MSAEPRTGQKHLSSLAALDGSFGSEADFEVPTSHVSFGPEADIGPRSFEASKKAASSL
jgi:hypothetical protein